MDLPCERGVLKQHIIKALKIYWPRNPILVENLPVTALDYSTVAIRGAVGLVLVKLPDWAAEYGVNGRIAVPREACSDAIKPDWQATDWWLAAFLMLECAHERSFEEKHGPVHSYSLRLRDWDANIWEHAWVNRIGLFLRAWAVQENNKTDERLFGPLPRAKFIITHDVDAISKTVSIRIKQGGFNLFNAVRALISGNAPRALKFLRHSAAIIFSNEDWWQLDEVLSREKHDGLHSHFNFFADLREKSFKSWLFDPGYKITDPEITEFVKNLNGTERTVGLHPSFDSWRNAEHIIEQKKNLDIVTGGDVETCRQHWLRFSWRDTWRVQEAAGLKIDTTMMFNDRPGLRNAAALQWNPWSPETRQSHAIFALPTVIMDSHLYDYAFLNDQERKQVMRKWIEEVREVGGVVAFLWHPHTLSDDFGWKSGFEDLLEIIGKE